MREPYLRFSMSEIILIKGCDRIELESGLVRLATSHKAKMRLDNEPKALDQKFRSNHSGNVHSFFIAGLPGKARPIWADVCKELQLVRIEVALQEKSFWEYILFTGDTEIDFFSVLPEAWDEGPDD